MFAGNDGRRVSDFILLLPPNLRNMNKTFKLILGVLGTLILIFFILALIAPKEYSVERTVVINAPADQLRDSLKSLRFFTKWDPWSEYDPQMKLSYSGENGTVGSSYSWVGNDQVGEGQMKILSVADSMIETEVHFIRPWESTSIAHYHIVPTPEGTKVSWGFSGKNPFPWNAFSLFMDMDKMLGQDFEKGLNKLKATIENMASSASAVKFEVKEEDLAERVFIVKKQEVKFQEMANFYGEYLPKLFEAVGINKLMPAGAPSGIFFRWDETAMSADMAAAIPVQGKSDTKVKDYDTYVQAAGKALIIDYYGAYENSANAHYFMDDYMKTNGYVQNGPVFEEYVTDPGVEKDTTKWLTRIYYMVEKK